MLILRQHAVLIGEQLERILRAHIRLVVGCGRVALHASTVVRETLGRVSASSALSRRHVGLDTHAQVSRVEHVVVLSDGLSIHQLRATIQSDAGIDRLPLATFSFHAGSWGLRRLQLL